MPEDPDPDTPLLEAVASTLGNALVAHTRVSSQISGNGIITSHQVEFESSDGRRESHLLYLETSPRRGERDGVLTFRDESSDDQVDVWVYPRDPALPALPAAVFPDGAKAILQRLGVDVGTRVTLTLEAYRPGKRAVIRVQTGPATVFLKVLAPGAAGKLAERHTAWLATGVPVPHVLGWSDEGLLAFSALDGTPAPTAIERLDPEHFITQIVRLQAEISGVRSAERARASLTARLPWYERRLTQAMPAQAARVHSLARHIEGVLSAATRPAPVTVHGDLHIGQLFLDPTTDAVSGVLDIDTAGLGDPADDAAALYAHLIVTALINTQRPAVADHCTTLAVRWRAHWRHHAEGPAFAARATAIAVTHLLAHALNQSLEGALLLKHAETLVAEDNERDEH